MKEEVKIRSMNPPKYNAIDYINFLIATQTAYSCAEAERVQPLTERPPTHDAINRLLHRQEPSTKTLWQETEPHVEKQKKLLVIDYSILDKFYAKHIKLVSRQ